MKRIFVTAAAAVMALTAAPAMAQVYGSVGYSRVDANGPEFDAVTGKLGWQSGWFGVEGEATAGFNEETVTVGATAVDVDLKHQLGIYAVGHVPMNENLDLFARVGYGQTRFEASAAGTTLGGTEHSVNYGAGAQYFFGGGVNGLRGEYTKHDFDGGGGADVDVWSASFVRRF